MAFISSDLNFLLKNTFLGLYITKFVVIIDLLDEYYICNKSVIFLLAVQSILHH